MCIDYLVRLLIFRQGIVYDRTIFISFSSWYWINGAVEAGKEFPNVVVEEEGHVNNCWIL